ncbi:hypothetical protein TrRE_jg692, partial [Triparma retinervis]
MIGFEIAPFHGPAPDAQVLVVPEEEKEKGGEDCKRKSSFNALMQRANREERKTFEEKFKSTITSLNKKIADGILMTSKNIIRRVKKGWRGRKGKGQNKGVGSDTVEEEEEEEEVWVEESYEDDDEDDDEDEDEDEDGSGWEDESYHRDADSFTVMFSFRSESDNLGVAVKTGDYIDAYGHNKRAIFITGIQPRSQIVNLLASLGKTVELRKTMIVDMASKDALLQVVKDAKRHKESLSLVLSTIPGITPEFTEDKPGILTTSNDEDGEGESDESAGRGDD